MARKNTTCTKKPGCLRRPGHPGRCGQLTKAEVAETTTPVLRAAPRARPAPRPRQPIEQALKEIAGSEVVKKTAAALPKHKRQRCPGCNKEMVRRPSGFPPHDNERGKPCSQQKPTGRGRKSPHPAPGKKFPCAVSKEDGCGRMIGVDLGGRIKVHKRVDGSECPGSNLKPGSPVPLVKPIRPLNQKTRPSRPFHDRMDRSTYFKASGMDRSRYKASQLREVVEQYGWETVQRESEDENGAKVELTFTRGEESIHIYWINGVCQGEDITYVAYGRASKLRNASAVKMRAAVTPDVSKTEVERKAANQTIRQRAIAQEARKYKASLKAPALNGKLAKMDDVHLLKEVCGKYISWLLKIADTQDYAAVPRDPRKVRITLQEPDDERLLTFYDAETRQARTVRVSAITRIQTTPMRRRRGATREEEEE